MVTRFVAIRHGKPDNEGYADELLRPLSKEGKVVQRLVAAQLEEEGLIPTAIFSSPILNCWQVQVIYANRSWRVRKKNRSGKHGQPDWQRLNGSVKSTCCTRILNKE